MLRVSAVLAICLALSAANALAKEEEKVLVYLNYYDSEYSIKNCTTRSTYRVVESKEYLEDLRERAVNRKAINPYASNWGLYVEARLELMPSSRCVAMRRNGCAKVVAELAIAENQKATC